jgi:dolichyl-phosphate beta-glucosyltransferase
VSADSLPARIGAHNDSIGVRGRYFQPPLLTVQDTKAPHNQMVQSGSLNAENRHARLMGVDPTTPHRLLGYSIIIPAYNEGARVGATLEKVLAHVAKLGWDAEIIAVDDGSRDNTVEIIRGYAEKNPRLRLLQNPGNRGKGYSVRNGMLHAQGELLLFSDADLSAPIEEADKLFGAIAGGADIAIGSRWLRRDLQTQRQPFYRQIFGRIFNLMLRVTLGLTFKDTQCGFKAFTRDAAMQIFPLQKIERWGFDPELLYLARKLKFKVAEVPVEWAHSEGTRISPLRDGTRMFLEMLKIRWNAITGKYDRDPE